MRYEYLQENDLATASKNDEYYSLGIWRKVAVHNLSKENKIEITKELVGFYRRPIIIA